MKSTWLLLAAILAGLFIHLQQPGDEPSPAQASPSAVAPSSQDSAEQNLSRSLSTLHIELSRALPRPSDSAIPDRRNPSPAAQRNTPRNTTIISRPLPPLAPQLTDTELKISAALTHNRADTELERLEKLLDLTQAQADEIFPILARRSAVYHPDLRIRIDRSETSNPRPLPDSGGRSTRGGPNDDPDDEPEIEDELEDILTPPQNQAFTTEQIESDEWWTEILSDLAASP